MRLRRRLERPLASRGDVCLKEELVSLLPLLAIWRWCVFREGGDVPSLYPGYLEVVFFVQSRLKVVSIPELRWLSVSQQLSSLPGINVAAPPLDCSPGMHVAAVPLDCSLSLSLV